MFAETPCSRPACDPVSTLGYHVRESCQLVACVMKRVFFLYHVDEYVKRLAGTILCMPYGLKANIKTTYEKYFES